MNPIPQDQSTPIIIHNSSNAQNLGRSHIINKATVINLLHKFPVGLERSSTPPPLPPRPAMLRPTPPPPPPPSLQIYDIKSNEIKQNSASLPRHRKPKKMNLKSDDGESMIYPNVKTSLEEAESFSQRRDTVSIK